MDVLGGHEGFSQGSRREHAAPRRGMRPRRTNIYPAPSEMWPKIASYLGLSRMLPENRNSCRRGRLLHLGKDECNVNVITLAPVHPRPPKHENGSLGKRNTQKGRLFAGFCMSNICVCLENVMAAHRGTGRVRMSKQERVSGQTGLLELLCTQWVVCTL